jgi:single-stranded DNA-binding protein
MWYVNSVVLKGYVNKNVREFTTKNGEKMYRFTLYQKRGNKKETIPVLSFGKEVKPGDWVLVVGRLSSDFYNQNLRVYVVANNVDIIERKTNGAEELSNEELDVGDLAVDGEVMDNVEPPF